MDTNDFIYKTDTDSQHRNQNDGYQRGKGGINEEFGVNRYMLLHTKSIHNKDLLYSIGNHIQ